jgi:uncharacterized RDD family membrane protein YckC
MKTPHPDTQPEFFDGILPKRFAAWVFDMLFVVLLCLVALPFTLFTGVFYFPVMMLVIGFLYRAATLANGSATWGMRLMAMELRDAEDRKLNGSMAILHTLGYSVSMAMFPLQLLSILLMLTNSTRQGLTDFVLGTVPLNRRKE